MDGEKVEALEPEKAMVAVLESLAGAVPFHSSKTTADEEDASAADSMMESEPKANPRFRDDLLY